MEESRPVNPVLRGPHTEKELEAFGAPATLSYIRHLECENTRLWSELGQMRDSFHIIASATITEINQTVSKANVTFSALERRMDAIIPTPYTGNSVVGGKHKKEGSMVSGSNKLRKRSSVLGKRSATPGSMAETTERYSLYPHPPATGVRKLRSRSSSLGRTFHTSKEDLSVNDAHPNMPDFVFGSPVSAAVNTPKRISGWPLPKAMVGNTPGRVLHKRSKTFHEASALTPNFSHPRDPNSASATSLALNTNSVEPYLLSGFSYANAKYFTYDNIVKGQILTSEGQELLRIQLKEMLANGVLTEQGLKLVKKQVDVYTRKKLFGDLD